LITLDENVPLEIDFASFSTDNLNYGAAAACLKKFGAFKEADSYAKEDSSNPYASSKTTSNTSEQNETAQVKEEVFELKQNSGNYSAVLSVKELSSIIDGILSGEKKVAFDTETTGLNTQDTELAGFSLCTENGRAFYIPVLLPGGMFAPETISKAECIKQLERLFNDESIIVIMHNGKFDLEVLKTNGMHCEVRCKIFDTMIAYWLLDSDAQGKSPYSLESLAEKLLHLKGIEFTSLVSKGQTFADVELDKAVPYGAEDADFTWQLYTLLSNKLKEEKLEDLFYEMEMKILLILTKMETAGIHLDKDALKEYSVFLAEEIKKSEEEICREAGHEFNVASPKQLQTVLFEERKLKATKKTKTGYSTDSAALEELMDTTDDVLPGMILNYRKIAKLQSTYVETLPLLTDAASRIHTSFLQTGTATGRLSSRDPNLQNIPVRDENGRRIRSAFTAEKGTVLISADYSQIELVILAHLSGDENLRNAFINGIDVHKSTAALVYGISPDEVTAEQRRFAKTVNFGVMYGMSAFRLASELKISRTEAKDFITRYFETYSGVKNFIAQTIRTAEEKGSVETIMGHRRTIRDISSKNKNLAQAAQRVAVNTPIQGSAADIVKKAMIDVNEALEKKGSPARMLLQVHDELIFECPDDEKTVAETTALIREKMENAVKLSVPLRVSIETGKNWGLFH
ncbi:MAG: DNA polymerase I, partial [Treponema sp.]|nr:DNA polymerase I [Treponema sp.]